MMIAKQTGKIQYTLKIQPPNKVFSKKTLQQNNCLLIISYLFTTCKGLKNIRVEQCYFHCIEQFAGSTIYDLIPNMVDNEKQTTAFTDKILAFL